MNEYSYQEQHLKSSDFITDIVITAGIAEIVAGCIAMGLGGYLAGKTEQEHYESELKREYYEVDNYHQKEIDEVKEIFADYGIDEAGQNLLANQLAKDKTKWVDFMMKFELGLEEPHPKRARNSALTIGVSYFIGGLLPLTAYFFTDTPFQGLIWSSVITIVSLFVFGYFKSKVTGQPTIWGAFKVTAVGVIAAAAAFSIAKLIG